MLLFPNRACLFAVTCFETIDANMYYAYKQASSVTDSSWFIRKILTSRKSSSVDCFQVQDLSAAIDHHTIRI